MSDRIPGKLVERHRLVRAAFVLRGSSFQAWCAANDVKPQNAHKAMTGQWTGPKAAALVDRILKDAGVAE